MRNLTRRYCLGRGRPPHQLASWSIQPFGHSTPNITRHTDRQTHKQQSDGIGKPFYKRLPKNCWLHTDWHLMCCVIQWHPNKMLMQNYLLTLPHYSQICCWTSHKWTRLGYPKINSCRVKFVRHHVMAFMHKHRTDMILWTVHGLVKFIGLSKWEICSAYVHYKPNLWDAPMVIGKLLIFVALVLVYNAGLIVGALPNFLQGVEITVLSWQVQSDCFSQARLKALVLLYLPSGWRQPQKNGQPSHCVTDISQTITFPDRRFLDKTFPKKTFPGCLHARLVDLFPVQDVSRTITFPDRCFLTEVSRTIFVSDIAIFVLKRDVKLQLTNSRTICINNFEYFGMFM